jgi:hypothetical protein
VIWRATSPCSLPCLSREMDLAMRPRTQGVARNHTQVAGTMGNIIHARHASPAESYQHQARRGVMTRAWAGAGWGLGRIARVGILQGCNIPKNSRYTQPRLC